MALTTAELVSGLFGFWSMGLAIWLFVPEFVDVWRHPMPEIDLPRFVFFAAWLIGDAVMLAGLLIVRKYILTQMILYAVVMVLEVALLLLMMWTVGDLCCAARAKRPSDNALAHLITGIHGRPHMPPGDKLLEQRQTARARERGELTPEERNRFRVRVQLGGTVAVLATFTVVWLLVDFREKEDKAPPPVSSLPDAAKSDYAAKMTAYILAWLGFPCWTLPRVYCLVDSYRKRAREGITVASILIGGLLHLLNIASVMLINPSGDPLLAQLPYLLTSIACVVLDGMRLGLTYVLRNAKQLPPAYDFSNMWPYERYLPDYDPTQYADLQRGVRSQPIVRRHKHTAVASSESEGDSAARPSEKVGRQFLRDHEHYAHAARNNLLPLTVTHSTDPHMYLPALWSNVPQSQADFKEDRTHHLKATRDWSRFREKQIHLHKLFQQLDEVKDQSDRLERQHKHLPSDSPELPKLEQELHDLQLEEDELKHDMRRIVFVSSFSSWHAADSSSTSSRLTEKDANAERTGLTPTWQRQLETEYKQYNQYAHERDRNLDKRRRARLERQFAAMESKLQALQDRLEKVQTERLAQEQRYVRMREHGHHAPQLSLVEQSLHGLQQKESKLESEIRHLLANPGWPTTTSAPHTSTRGDASLDGETLRESDGDDSAAAAAAAAAELQHKLEAKHEQYVHSRRDRAMVLQRLESRRRKGLEPAEWSDDVNKSINRIAEPSSPEDSSAQSSDGEHLLLKKRVERKARRLEQMKAMREAYDAGSRHKPEGSRSTADRRHR